jgi:hypothetical protein
MHNEGRVLDYAEATTITVTAGTVVSIVTALS